MNKLKILVACHKAVEVFENDVYVPIHVGKALHPNLELGFIGDNIGDNISMKNPFYSELTAQYWAWKNLDSEYVGLCHYRRYFATEYTNHNIEEELDGYDVILASSVAYPKSIFTRWENDLVNEDIHIFYQYMITRFPSQKDEIDDFFIKNNRYNPANMFVCKKTLFDKFAEWQFSILFDLEKYILSSEYSRPRRLFGYLSEGLLPFYMKLNGLRIKEVPLVPMIGSGQILFKNSVKFKIKNWLYFERKKNEYKYELPDDVKCSLVNAGVFKKLQNEFFK